jgi:ABC-type glycerol-3-phosphate transport system substrate-binding protein
MGKAIRHMNNYSKMIPRRGFLSGAFTVGGMALAGRAGQAGYAQITESGVSSSRSTLEVAAPTAAMAEWVKQTAKPWARRKGVEIVMRVGVPEGKIGKNQLAIVPPRVIGKLIGELGKVPVDFIGRPECAWPDLLPVWRERLGRWRGETVAVPLMGDLWVQVVRSDWMADETLQKAHGDLSGNPLRAPRLWEEWIVLGKALHGKLPGRKGAPALGALPGAVEDQLRLLRQVAASHSVERLAAGQKLRAGKEAENSHYAVDFELLTGKPKVAGKAFVYALEWMSRLQAYLPGKADGQPWQAFERGESFAAIVPSQVIARLQRGALRDRFDIHPLPGAEKVFLDEGELQAGQGNFIPLVGTGGAMAVASSEAISLVWDLLSYLIQPKTQLDLVLDPNFGGPVREQQLPGAPWDGLQLDLRRLGQWQTTLRTTLSPAETVNPAVVLRTPDAEQLDAELGKQVASCLAGKGKAVDCLRAAADAWETMGRNRPGRLVEVRASTGLS